MSVWTPGRVAGLGCVFKVLVLLALYITAPTAAEMASHVDFAAAPVWNLAYDRQFAHLQKLERAAERLGLVGIVLVWFPKHWLPPSLRRPGGP